MLFFVEKAANSSTAATPNANNFKSILEQQLARQMNQQMRSQRSATVNVKDSEEDNKQKKLGNIMQDDSDEDDIGFLKSNSNNLPKKSQFLSVDHFLELDKPLANRRHSKRAPLDFN